VDGPNLYEQTARFEATAMSLSGPGQPTWALQQVGSVHRPSNPEQADVYQTQTLGDPAMLLRQPIKTSVQRVRVARLEIYPIFRPPTQTDFAFETLPCFMRTIAPATLRGKWFDYPSFYKAIHVNKNNSLNISVIVV
jgi:hypothetical protein